MDNIVASRAAVRSSSISGNGLFATRDIDAGELVLMIKRPLVGVLDIPRLEDSCSNCFMWSQGSIEGSLSGKTPTVNACTGCKKVKYCSKKCQSQAWKREHKHVCKFLKELPLLPNAVRAARELSVLMNSSSVSDEVKKAVSGMEKHTITTIMNGASDPAMEQVFGVSTQATRDLLMKENPHFYKEQGIEGDYVGQIWRNSLTLVTPTFDPLGLAFDPLICSANHSCDPNSIVVMDGPLISIRSLMPIQKDDEIFISYIDNTNPFSVRQAELRERYCFNCACTKCSAGPTGQEDEWLGPASSLPEKFSKLGASSSSSPPDPKYLVGDSPSDLQLSSLQALVFQSLESARTPTLSLQSQLEKLEAVLQLCHQSTIYPLTRQPYASARNEVFPALVGAGNVGMAMYQMIKIYFTIDPVLYPQSFHPVRVVHTFALAKLMLWLYAQRNQHHVTRMLVSQGFDFVVVIWKLLRQLRDAVRLSHGVGRFQIVVDRTVGEVAREVGEKNLRLLEADPQGMWEIFRIWKDAVEY